MYSPGPVKLPGLAHTIQTSQALPMTDQGRSRSPAQNNPSFSNPPLCANPPQDPLTSSVWPQFRYRSPFATPGQLLYITTQFPSPMLGTILQYILLNGIGAGRTVCSLNPEFRLLHRFLRCPRPRSQDKPPSSTSSKHQ